MEETKYHPIPQPEEISEREREDAMGAYLMMFASLGLGLPLPFVNILAAVVYYYVNRSKGRFVRFHALQSMHSQIVISLINSALITWGFLILADLSSPGKYFTGLLLAAGVFNLVYFIFSIVGAVYARKGRFYYFLFFGKYAYHLAYAIREEKIRNNVNLPPV